MKKKGSIKKIFAIFAIVILVGAIIGIIIVNMNTQQRATRKLTKLGEKFYSYYYDDNSDKNDKDKVKVFLSKYADTGISISLKNLRTYLDTKKVENYNVFNKCNQDQTKVTIFPISPYNKKDRTIQISLDCDF